MEQYGIKFLIFARKFVYQLESVGDHHGGSHTCIDHLYWSSNNNYYCWLGGVPTQEQKHIQGQE